VTFFLFYHFSPQCQVVKSRPPGGPAADHDFSCAARDFVAAPAFWNTENNCVLVVNSINRRYRGQASRIYFRADAGFAKPEVYQYLGDEGIKYSIRLPPTAACWKWLYDENSPLFGSRPGAKPLSASATKNNASILQTAPASANLALTEASIWRISA
jgi:hypothetical protein